MVLIQQDRRGRRKRPHPDTDVIQMIEALASPDIIYKLKVICGIQ